MAISVTINASKVGSALAALSKNFGNREIAHRQIATQLFSWVQRNFDAEGGLRTTPWSPLAPSTVKQKARLGYSSRMLIRTGNLRQSFAPFSNADQAGVGARASAGVDYAQVHEEGRPDRNLPARPMLPPIDVAEGYVTRVYDRFILQSRKDARL